MNDAPKRLFLLAAYDSHGTVGTALQFYAQALSEEGTLIVVMDNDSDPEQLQKLSRYTVHTEAVRHCEYDFGSYKRAWNWAKANLQIENYSYLYLVNDSVYGPLFPLRQYLEQMESMKAGAFGMVLNPHRHDRHLQSWFIGLGKDIFMSEWFGKFISGIHALDSKESVCNIYETGLTKLIETHGHTCDGLFTIKGKGIYNNVASSYAKGLPFIKKNSFVRHNGSLGREINSVLKKIPSDIRNAIIEDASRTMGEKYITDLLSGNMADMTARYIRYICKKLH